MKQETTKLTIIATVLALSAFNTAMVGAQPVYFADANLKKAVEDGLGVFDPTAEDMWALTFLDVYEGGIVDLIGLEYAVNLRELYLTSNPLSDISSLSGLTNLTMLLLSDNQIADISPLSGLTNLMWLYLFNNQISDISPLSGMTNLMNLYLGSNEISDVEPLSGMTNMTELYLDDNQIIDISPLSGMTNLTELYLEANPLNREAYCTYLPLIETNNPGIDTRYDPAPSLCGCPIPPPLVGDLDENCRVNWGDFAIFASHWLQSPCTADDWCGGADMDHSGQVNWGDFAIFASHWLECNGSECD